MENIDNTTDLILHKQVSAADIDRFVNEYKAYTKKSAENTIQIGRIVFGASVNLGSQYNEFVRRIGYADSNSTVSKLKKIGEKFDVLYPLAENLPVMWTSIYKIAGIEDHVLKRLIEEGKIHSTVSGKEVDQILKELKPKKDSDPKPDQTQPQRLGFECESKAVLTSEQCKKLKDIIEELKSLQFEVNFSDDLKAIIETE